MTTSQELDAKVAELERQLEEARKAADAQRLQEKNLIIGQINGLIAEHHITAQELTFPGAPRGNRVHPAKALKGAVGKPKYRNAETGATWTGHGKPPGWIARFDKKGREQFLIEK
ncbi:H-NS histone family protein [Ralstonia sp. 25C]|uniref:H-NS histone family protein n=1 Tax=Ralstonia sp. 25C TaxID=3447363 RepID=UPI003F74C938